MSIFVEIVNSIFEVFIVLFFFKQTLSSKSQKKWIKYSTVIIISTIHIVRSFAHIPTYINFCITFALWCVFLILLFDGSQIRKIIMISIYFVIFIVCDMLTRFIVASILNITYSTSSPTGLERYLGMVISLILNFVMIYSVSLFIRKRQITLSLKYWIMLLLFPLFSLFIVICTDSLILLANIHNIKYIILLLIIVLGLLYFNTVVFEFIDSYSSKLQLEAAQELIAAQEENYQLLESNETTLRILQHNINKHMEIMNNIVSNDVPVAKEFAQSLKDLTAVPLGIVYTNDMILDAILNLECKKAAAAKIQYTVKVNRITEPLNIISADKSTILCNAIDNAIEACYQMREKFIIIDIASDKQYIKVQIENSSLPIKIKDNTILTSKKNTALHGFGLKSMKQAIKKYNGHLNISYKDGITTLIILMDNSQEQIHAKI
ncbi:sensor histidine kinase [Lachnospiraceae bacterium MD329]|nr:sensor histidine kinase [Lachnospiraceae bacterium MD329]